MTENTQTQKTETALNVRGYLRSPEIMERFAEAIGQHQASAYISSVLLAVANNETLARCTPQSIAVSAMRAATLRLSCDPATGQAHLVPFKGKATLIVGYKGLIQMALRTNKYRYINVYPIREGHEVSEHWKTGHHSLGGKKVSDTVIGHLLSFQMTNGFEKTIYMTVEEIHEHARKTSKSYNYSDSPWKTHTFEMEQKTVIRLGLGKWGFFDPHDVLAMSQADDIDLPETVAVKSDPVARSRSTAETVRDMGYEVDENTGEVIDGEVSEQPSESKTGKLSRENAQQQETPWTSERISLETAKAEKSSDGTLYWEMPDDQLAVRFNSLQKSLEKNNLALEQKTERLMKRDVIQAILDYRHQTQELY
jgi:recombination protein RecT